MKKTKQLLSMGLESSSGLTKEFKQFYSTFRTEFKKELKTIDATDIVFSRGHFNISGFFTVNNQAYYFSISDVRSPMSKILYRTAMNYKDYTGGANQYVGIESGMCKRMNIN
ncbi:MAG: hypothetical protein PF487_06675 [Bacteroidales bacterium]|jgi:hypothetical protein|nr:hypothetical protein [Bacteroidales bacterium]